MMFQKQNRVSDAHSNFNRIRTWRNYSSYRGWVCYQSFLWRKRGKEEIVNESIRNHLTKSNKYKNRIFLTSTTEGLSDILDAYHSSTRTKPKNEQNQPIAKEGLVAWCNSVIDGEYVENSSDSEAFVSWCYINTNSFEKELDGSGRTKITQSESTHADWVSAWDKYSKNKDTSGLKITDNARDTHLNGGQKTEGQAALKAWCDEKATTKMYVDTAENDFARFKEWCTK